MFFYENMNECSLSWKLRNDLALTDIKECFSTSEECVGKLTEMMEC